MVEKVLSEHGGGRNLGGLLQSLYSVKGFLAGLAREVTGAGALPVGWSSQEGEH